MKDQLFLALAAYKAALARIDKLNAAEATVCRSAYTGSAFDDARRAVALRSLLTKIEVSSFVTCLSHIGSLENVDLSVEIRALEATLELPYYTGCPGYNGLVENVAQAMWYPKPVPSLTALEERIARIEKRENALAELFKQISTLELQLRHAADKARAKQEKYRTLRRSLSLEASRGLRMPFLKDDPEYARLTREIRGLFDSVRRIRETTLPVA